MWLAGPPVWLPQDHDEQCLRRRGHETKSGKDQAFYGGDAGWELTVRLAVQDEWRGQTDLIT